MQNDDTLLLVTLDNYKDLIQTYNIKQQRFYWILDGGGGGGII